MSRIDQEFDFRNILNGVHAMASERKLPHRKIAAAMRSGPIRSRMGYIDLLRQVLEYGGVLLSNSERDFLPMISQLNRIDSNAGQSSP